MDDCLPAILRDNRYFMWPFFYLAYRGKNIHTAMHFKTVVQKFTAAEYQRYYAELNSISRNRQTDLNHQSIDFIDQAIEHHHHSLIDVGCGNGYLLAHLSRRHPQLHCTGCDVIDKPRDFNGDYLQSDIQQLPIADKQYDVVTCCHTLEHVPDLKSAVAQLIRICRQKLLIIVPCQRYFYYTLDEHIHFFTHVQQLLQMMGLNSQRILHCEKHWGDWVLVIDCDDECI